MIRTIAPPVFFAFLIFMPAGLQLSVLTGALFSVSQGYILRRAWFREWASIQPLPQKPESPVSNSGTTASSTVNLSSMERMKKSIFSPFADLRGATSEMVEKGRTAMGHKKKKTVTTSRATPESKQAQQYEERRQREIAQQRFEAQQAKTSKRRARQG